MTYKTDLACTMFKMTYKTDLACTMFKMTYKTDLVCTMFKMTYRFLIYLNNGTMKDIIVSVVKDV